MDNNCKPINTYKSINSISHIVMFVVINNVSMY